MTWTGNGNKIEKWTDMRYILERINGMSGGFNVQAEKKGLKENS